MHQRKKKKMPKKIEKALKKSASKKGLTGKRANAYIYGSLNNMGYMKGNKKTRKK